MISNRVEMLVNMILTDTDNADKIFDALVPKYHSELYVLYNILNDTNVLHDCELSLTSIPEDDAPVSIRVQLSSAILDNIICYVNDNGDILKPFRNSDPVSMEFEKVTDGLIVRLN